MTYMHTTLANVIETEKRSLASLKYMEMPNWKILTSIYSSIHQRDVLKSELRRQLNVRSLLLELVYTQRLRSKCRRQRLIRKYV